MTADLVAFLRAQLDVDEQVARAALQPQAWVEYDDLFRPTRSPAHRAHIARWDPARVLADVEAKRRIVDLHVPRGVEGGPPYRWTCRFCDHAPVPWEAYLDWPCETLRLLALPFADREGYREEWKP